MRFVSSETLRRAADILAEFSAAQPADERLTLHFQFALEELPLDLGPDTLAFIGWTLQRRFTDPRCRLLSNVDRTAFGRMRTELQRPRPVPFFQETADESPMNEFARRLYGKRAQAPA